MTGHDGVEVASVTVNVSTELLAELGEWSEPVQVRIEKVGYGTGWEMVFQRAEPTDVAGCCARDEGHDGPCEWECEDCGGTGRCGLCAEECICDDVVQCAWCDGSEACPSCDDGRVVAEVVS